MTSNWLIRLLLTTCVELTDCIEKLKNALFMVGEIGGNDYNYALFQGKTMEEVESLVPDVVRVIKDAVRVSFRINHYSLYLASQ